MKLIRNYVGPAMVAVIAMAWSSLAEGATIHEVTGWRLHTQVGPDPPGITDGTTNSPTFNVNTNVNASRDNAAVMGTFPTVALANDGDFMTLNAKLTMTDRSNNLGAAGLSTHLRIGLFDGPDGTVVTDDFPNTGIFMVYAHNNQAVGHRVLRAQTSLVQTLPLSGSTADNIASGTADAGDDNIQGANPGPIDFELTLTRNGALLDILGTISGTDSVTGNPYLSTYALAGYNPSNIGLDFNRVGMFFGPQVNAPTALLEDVTITTNVPEPAFSTLAAVMAVGGLLIGRRKRHIA